VSRESDGLHGAPGAAGLPSPIPVALKSREPSNAARIKKAAFPASADVPTHPTKIESSERQAMGRFVSDRQERQLSRSA
jgi:hypothetical protein